MKIKIFATQQDLHEMGVNAADLAAATLEKLDEGVSHDGRRFDLSGFDVHVELDSESTPGVDLQALRAEVRGILQEAAPHGSSTFVSAIKRWRNVTGCSLVQAKEEVERVMREAHILPNGRVEPAVDLNAPPADLDGLIAYTQALRRLHGNISVGVSGYESMLMSLDLRLARVGKSSRRLVSRGGSPVLVLSTR